MFHGLLFARTFGIEQVAHLDENKIRATGLINRSRKVVLMLVPFCAWSVENEAFLLKRVALSGRGRTLLHRKGKQEFFGLLMDNA